MNKYLIFILFGIIIFILLNKYNTFNIGNQFSIYNKPCTCSDEFNMPFQDEISCRYSYRLPTGDEGEYDDGLRPIRIDRIDFFGNECVWTGDTSLLTTLDLDIIAKLYQIAKNYKKAEKFYDKVHKDHNLYLESQKTNSTPIENMDTNVVIKPTTDDLILKLNGQ